MLPSTLIEIVFNQQIFSLLAILPKRTKSCSSLAQKFLHHCSFGLCHLWSYNSSNKKSLLAWDWSCWVCWLKGHFFLNEFSWTRKSSVSSPATLTENRIIGDCMGEGLPHSNTWTVDLFPQDGTTCPTGLPYWHQSS